MNPQDPTDESDSSGNPVTFGWTSTGRHIIDALSEPAAYAHRVDAVQVHQTHISVVFLAGPFAYKLKKPVDLGFLDFSTLARRRHFCDEEIRLNRRLAPTVYLGVVPVTRHGQHIAMEGTGEVIEWAVKMQRLPDEATLHERLGRGEVGLDLVEALAGRIASFHQEAERSETMYGSFEAVARNLRDIYRQSIPQVGTTVSPPVFDRLQALSEEALSRHQHRIEERARRGMTRDTHGDLHLDHIYYFPDQEPPGDLVIVDCIEFNERFRFTDPVADMAFPVMDLAFHGRRDLARAFADAYFRATGDEDGRPLLPLYTTYRATVRGSVEGLELAEKEVPDSVRAAVLQTSRGHWLLALSLADRPERRPCLLLVAGLPGTGKSTVARGLAERAGFSVIRSDVVRKELAGPVGDIYTADWNQRTYAECLGRAEQLLFEGQRVIVDATFREDQQRRLFLQAALRLGVPILMLQCRADPETVRQRLHSRQHDVSDADWNVYLQAAGLWEEATSSTRGMIHEIATGGSFTDAVNQALHVLQEQELGAAHGRP